ncbi:hypothetical protein [Nocardia vaccinii]|uniref:hypothetical protein n=1 Tax=Nocardia vaccinii TaxID=1822 RepID=UPI00082A9A41|nr:hypothetical protein [Nocardia vaccinii]
MNTSDHDVPASSPPPAAAGITGPNELVIRAGQIPPGQAMMLRHIQELAAKDADLHRHRASVEHGTADEARHATSAAELDRLRGVLQMRARAAGVPVEWIARVTQLGQQGIGWHEDHLLPNPITFNQRRSVHRIAQDTRHLTDMAALAVVREHHTARADLTVPDPVTAGQYTRTMHALWLRATRTGQTITLSPRARRRAWGIDQDTLVRRVHGLLHLSATDIDMLWRHHAAPALTDRLRASLRELRDAVPEPSAADPEVHAPEPKQILAAARAALYAVVAEQQAPVIGEFIAEVLPQVDQARAWHPDTATTPDTDHGVPPHRGGGPDP